MQPGEPTEIDYVALLVGRWRRVLVATILAIGLATAYAFMADEWYSARLSVVPASRSPESAAMALASKLPGIDAGAADSLRIEAVLTSASVTDAVIEKFALQRRYGTAFHEQTRKELWAHCETAVHKKSGVVSLTCEDRDPRFVQELASYFGEVGNQVFGRVTSGSAQAEARFLETQVARARAQVDAAALKLREFQEANKVIDLPEQSKAVISAMASIQGDLLSKELELSYLRGFSARDEASVLQLQRQIGILRGKLGQLEAEQARGGPGPGSGFFPEAMTVPKLRAELELLLREQKIAETVLLLLTQRWEMAQVDAARDTPTFQILDHPTVPTFRSRPVRRKVMALGGALGVGAGAAWAIVPAWWRRRRAARAA